MLRTDKAKPRERKGEWNGLLVWRPCAVSYVEVRLSLQWFPSDCWDPNIGENRLPLLVWSETTLQNSSFSESWDRDKFLGVHHGNRSLPRKEKPNPEIDFLKEIDTPHMTITQLKEKSTSKVNVYHKVLPCLTIWIQYFKSFSWPALIQKWS